MGASSSSGVDGLCEPFPHAWPNPLDSQLLPPFVHQLLVGPKKCVGLDPADKLLDLVVAAADSAKILGENQPLNWNRSLATRTNSGIDRSTAPTTAAGLDIWNIWSSLGRASRTSSALISLCPELASSKAPNRTSSFRSDAPSRSWTAAELLFCRANMSLLPSLAVRSFTPAARAAYPSFDLSAGMVSPGSSTRAFAWPGFSDSTALISFRVSGDLARPSRSSLRNVPMSASTIFSANSVPLDLLVSVKTLLKQVHKSNQPMCGPAPPILNLSI